MRCAIVTAAALILTGLSAGAAEAQQWCGYAGRANSIVECGYTSLQGCESANGKGAMCFINPDVAVDRRRGLRLATPQRPDRKA